LEAARQLRERVVREQELKLRAIRAEWDAHVRRIESFEEELRNAESAVARPGVCREDLSALDAFRASAVRRRMRLEQQKIEIGKRLAEQQSLWINAERDLRLVERLKEKAHQHWEKEYDKEQAALAEEAYLARWGR
jgi:flagellar export protein FliJ